MDVGGRLVERLLLESHPAEEERQPKYQEQVADNRSDQGGFDDCELAGVHQEDPDDQLRQVAERGVEQSPAAGSDTNRELLGGGSNESGERHDSQRGGREYQYRLMEEQVGDQGDRHEHEQP